MRVDAILKLIEGLRALEVTELKARIAERFPDTPVESNISRELAKLCDERTGEELILAVK